jgi:crotonobetainyl-CoA:carnitine CoA-transferase CaiB-like acyl-CoA transferase
MRRLPVDANRLLAGIVVLDFGQVYQGPYATLLMAKAGADVIKIEPPPGEPLRRRGAAGQEHDLSDRDAELQQACDHIELEQWTLLSLERPNQA